MLSSWECGSFRKSSFNDSCSQNFEVEGNISNDYTAYDEHIAGNYLWKIVSPVMIVLGSIGNILSIVVLNRKSIRNSVCSVYLTALAISDQLSLSTGLMRNWILYTFKMDVRELSEEACKLHTWLVYFSVDFSAWMIVIVTVERAGLVCFPTYCKRFCSRVKALTTISVVAIMLMVLNGHMLFGLVDRIDYTGNRTTTVQRCTFINTDYKYFFNYTWAWIDFSIFCAVPSFILVVGNFMIISKVIISKRNLARIEPSQNQTRHTQKITSMTAMLLCLNTVFLLSTTPISVYIICYNKWYKEASSQRDIAVLSLMWPVTNVLMYTNNTVNFGLYVLSGKRFRTEAFKLLCDTHIEVQIDNGAHNMELRSASQENIRQIEVLAYHTDSIGPDCKQKELYNRTV